MTSTWLLADATLVPLDGPPASPLGHVRRGSLRIDGDRILELGELQPRPGEVVYDGNGLTLLPGFVQGHVHACQTLFAGLADDLPLLAWLQRRIWPLEHAHDAASAAASAELTFAWLLRGGTTSVQTMESVRHSEAACAAAVRAKMTAIVGNALMDVQEEGVPKDLPTDARTALRLCDELRRACEPTAGRVQCAVAPRFLLSCSDGLLRDAAAYARQHSLRVHTHAGEHPDEVAAVRARFGTDYLLALRDCGLLGERTGLAHCVHTSEAERGALVTAGSAVLHCPSANLKLGSGIAPITTYHRRGVRLALGADGAPCNNRLSMLTELRQAALLQSLAAGPGAWPAATALWTATRGGARALGLDRELGCLQPGLRADLLLFDLADPMLPRGADLASQIVYAADERHLRHVICGGHFAVRDGVLCTFDAKAVAHEADRQLRALLSRAGLAR